MWDVTELGRPMVPAQSTPCHQLSDLGLSPCSQGGVKEAAPPNGMGTTMEGQGDNAEPGRGAQGIPYPLGREHWGPQPFLQHIQPPQLREAWGSVWLLTASVTSVPGLGFSWP